MIGERTVDGCSASTLEGEDLEAAIVSKRGWLQGHEPLEHGGLLGARFDIGADEAPIAASRSARGALRGDAPREAPGEHVSGGSPDDGRHLTTG
jgi:hypothetical protein